MDKAAQNIITEIDSLLVLAKNLSDKYKINSNDNWNADEYFNLQHFCSRTKFIFNGLPLLDKSFLGTLNGFELEHLEQRKNCVVPFDEHLLDVVVCLKSTKKALEEDLLYSIDELINADYFDSHLEMANNLLKKKYKDAAAVIIGGVLENILRQQSKKRKLPLKDDKGRFLTMGSLNDNLKRDKAYNSNIHKRIIHLSEIRNNAAHGKHEEYSLNDVKEFYEYVSDFST